MKLLTKHECLSLMVADTFEITASEEDVRMAIGYANEVWTSVGLQDHELGEMDINNVYKHGSCLFFYFNALLNQQPETFLIVVIEEGNLIGHILMDLAAEYGVPYMICPAQDFQDDISEEQLRDLIPQIDAQVSNPFAILMTGEGTYMQTFREPDGFALEYQLVNTASHYQANGLVSQQQVIDAMVSFGFGNNEWLESIDWQIQHLN